MVPFVTKELSLDFNLLLDLVLLHFIQLLLASFEVRLQQAVLLHKLKLVLLPLQGVLVQVEYLVLDLQVLQDFFSLNLFIE